MWSLKQTLGGVSVFFLLSKLFFLDLSIFKNELNLIKIIFREWGEFKEIMRGDIPSQIKLKALYLI